MNLPNYRIYDCTGGGVTHDIYAETLAAAIEAGREWIEDGDWECNTHATELSCEVGPIIRDVDGSIDDDATDVANREDCSGVCPVVDAPDCADGQEHDWQSPYSVVGGCKENPGVWGSGHGGVRIEEVCRHCGLYRIVDTGATDSSNGTRCESTEYREADEASLDYVWGDEKEWTQWVLDHDDEDVLDDDDLVSAFHAIFRREPDDQERVEGLWSHLNASVDRG